MLFMLMTQTVLIIPLYLIILIFVYIYIFFFRRCNNKEFCPTYNRDTLSVVCASSMILGLITLLSVSRCLT